MIASLLPLLKFAPAIFEGASAIIGAVTGSEPPDEARQSPEAMAEHIEGLPPEQRAAVTSQLLAFKAAIQRLDTERFLGLTDGDAEKVRSTARPQIALQAMAVIGLFSKLFAGLVIVTILEWFARLVTAALGLSFPEISLWDLVADAAPVAEMIWGPLIASFWVCASVIKKYMGVRERDKAHEYEIKAGRPLGATEASIAAAGTGIAQVVRAWKDR